MGQSQGKRSQGGSKPRPYHITEVDRTSYG